MQTHTPSFTGFEDQLQNMRKDIFDSFLTEITGPIIKELKDTVVDGLKIESQKYNTTTKNNTTTNTDFSIHGLHPQTTTDNQVFINTPQIKFNPTTTIDDLMIRNGQHRTQTKPSETKNYLINEPDVNGITAFVNIVMASKPEIIMKAIFVCNANVNTIIDTKHMIEYYLVNTTMKNKWEIVKLLIENEVNLGFKNLITEETLFSFITKQNSVPVELIMFCMENCFSKLPNPVQESPNFKLFPENSKDVEDFSWDALASRDVNYPGPTTSKLEQSSDIDKLVPENTIHANPIEDSLITDVDPNDVIPTQSPQNDEIIYEETEVTEGIVYDCDSD